MDKLIKSIRNKCSKPGSNSTVTTDPTPITLEQKSIESDRIETAKGKDCKRSNGEKNLKRNPTPSKSLARKSVVNIQELERDKSLRNVQVEAQVIELMGYHHEGKCIKESEVEPKSGAKEIIQKGDTSKNRVHLSTDTADEIEQTNKKGTHGNDSITDEILVKKDNVGIDKIVNNAVKKEPTKQKDADIKDSTDVILVVKEVKVGGDKIVDNVDMTEPPKNKEADGEDSTNEILLMEEDRVGAEEIVEKEKAKDSINLTVVEKCVSVEPELCEEKQNEAKDTRKRTQEKGNRETGKLRKHVWKFDMQVLNKLEKKLELAEQEAVKRKTYIALMEKNVHAGKVKLNEIDHFITHVKEETARVNLVLEESNRKLKEVVDESEDNVEGCFPLLEQILTSVSLFCK